VPFRRWGKGKNESKKRPPAGAKHYSKKKAALNVFTEFKDRRECNPPGFRTGTSPERKEKAKQKEEEDHSATLSKFSEGKSLPSVGGLFSIRLARH